MKREDRYIVLKLTDVTECLSEAPMGMLSGICDLVAKHREAAGKRPLRTVVVESDWPEYEPVWGMLERRVDGAMIGTADDGIPIMAVRAEGRFKYPVPSEDGTYNEGCHLVFECPKCSAYISHGGTYGKVGAGDGHRCSHCDCWPKGYYLKEIEAKGATND